MMKMKTTAMASMLIMVMMVAGCQALLGISPKSFPDRLAAGYSSVTTVRESATVLLNRGVLTANDAQNVQNQANSVRQGLDVADALYKIRPADGEDKLIITLRILNTLEAYLEEKQK